MLKLLEEKLKRLYEINNSTAGLFRSVTNWLGAIYSAINDLQVSITGKGCMSSGSWKDVHVPSFEEKGGIRETEEVSEDSIIDISGLISLNSVTFLKDAMKNVNRGMTQEKLQTAIYLTNSILNDPELVAKGADYAWACGVVANMLFEGQPGLMESYHYKKSPMPNYLQNAVNHGYDKAYDANKGNLSRANTIPDLVSIINCTSHGRFECGFGFGMFQWTINRTADVLRTQ